MGDAAEERRSEVEIPMTEHIRPPLHPVVPSDVDVVVPRAETPAELMAVTRSGVHPRLRVPRERPAPAR
jgi:hypothetical protein